MDMPGALIGAAITGAITWWMTDWYRVIRDWSSNRRN